MSDKKVQAIKKSLRRLIEAAKEFYLATQEMTIHDDYIDQNEKELNKDQEITDLVMELYITKNQASQEL